MTRPRSKPRSVKPVFAWAFTHHGEIRAIRFNRKSFDWEGWRAGLIETAIIRVRIVPVQQRRKGKAC